jgi:hypothetical protein
MRLRRLHRRNLVVWNQSASPVGRRGAWSLTRVARTGRVRRGIRTGALLIAIGLIRLACAVWTYWRPLLAGGVLTAGAFMQHSSTGNVLFLPGVLLFFLLVLLTPPSSEAGSIRRPEPQRELARYSTPARRRHL